MEERDLSRAAKAILQFHPQEFVRLNWGQVGALLDLALLGDVIQQDPADDLAVFRGPIKRIHGGTERVIIEADWIAHREFPGYDFVHQPHKRKVFVPNRGLPWLGTNGVIHCPSKDGKETWIHPRTERFWNYSEIRGLPGDLWVRSLLRHMNIPNGFADKVIPLRAA